MAETANLAAALAKFQAEMPIVPKKQTARIPGKDGKQGYTYTYAGLADVTEAALPILTKHGLAFVALPTATDRGFILTGVLLHESGERLEGSLPIAGSRPQDIGSSITYGRRYLFGCMTGLVTDDDDDGQLAQRAERTRLTHDAPPASPPPDDLTAGLEGQVAAMTEAELTTGPPLAPMTDKTRGGMFAELTRHKIPDGRQLASINALLGTDYTSRGDLTETHAKLVIADLKRRPVTT